MCAVVDGVGEGEGWEIKSLGRVGKREVKPNAVSVMEIVSHADDNTNSSFNIGGWCWNSERRGVQNN